MKENNRKLIYLVLLIAITITAAGVATYAYFSSSVNANANVPMNVATANGSVFTASSEGGIDLDLGFEQMGQANVSTNAVTTDNAIVTVKVDSENEREATICTYDLVWVWDSVDTYTESDVTLPHTQDDKTYNYEFSTMVDNASEKDLSTLTWQTKDGKRQAVISTGKIMIGGKGSKINTHEVDVRVYNLPVNQTNLFNKTFKAHLIVENVDCSSQDISNAKALATYVTGTVYSSTPNQTNIASNAAGLYKHDSRLINGAQDGTYRYAGADASVNNYVCFMGDDCANENNLYRIISVDPATNQTKVIKATSLGDMKWNDVYSGGWIAEKGYAATGTAEDLAQGLTTGEVYYNIWAIQKADGSYYKASLNEYLNTEYLREIEKKTDKIENTTWSIAGIDNTTRNTKGVKENRDVELNNKATYEAKIGLIYASEYGYAALPEYWTLKIGYTSDATTDYRASKGNDWLWSASYPWTISRISGYTNYTLYVTSDGYMYGYYVYRAFEVRPSFNLSSSIKIINAEVEGVGSKNNPMILI